MASPRIPLEQAVERLLACVRPIGLVETVPLMEAAGRVAAETAVARIAQPPFDRSPLDGFAFHHSDVADASPERPARLRIVATVYAGDAPPDRIERGEAVRLMTGAPIPPGATCVVRQEDVTVADGAVLVPVRLEEYDNYCFRGEYLAAGRCLFRDGEVVDAGRIALLAGDGRETLQVFARPRVGILSTGCELTRPGEPLSDGGIYDSNRVAVAARVGQCGAVVAAAASEGDNPDAIARAVERTLEGCDIVITTGGVSVGERDCLPAAGERLGAETLFHGVQVKPGSPALGLVRNGRPILGLSGNPFAAMVTFELLAAPVIRKLAGWAKPESVRTTGVLDQPFPKGGGMRRFAPARLVGGTVTFPAGTDNRSLATWVDANCLLDVPAGSAGLDAGARVEVVLL